MIHSRFIRQNRLISGSIYQYQPFFHQRRFAGYWKKAPGTRQSEYKAKGHVLTPELQALYKEKHQQVHKRERIQAQQRRQEGGLIPLEVLQSAHKSGFLKIEPNLAYDISEAVSNVGITVDRHDVAILKKDYNVTGDQLATIARILVRMLDTSRSNIGSTFLFALSEAGSAKATVIVASSARRQGALNRLMMRPVINQLKQLAAKKEDLEAMTLVGQLAEDEGRAVDAIGWYETVVQKLGESDSSETVQDDEWSGAMDGVLHEKDQATGMVPVEKAYISLGRLLLKKHYSRESEREKAAERAKEAYKVGAERFNDPEAYNLLADYEPLWTEKWLQYHSEAATRGNTLSQHELGKFYSLPSSFLDGSNPLLQRITQYTTEADKEATFDEIWHTYNYTEDDIQDILFYGEHAKETFSTSLPASLRTEKDRYVYATEWLYTSGLGPWDFVVNGESYLVYYLPALMRAVNLTFRETPRRSLNSFLEQLFPIRSRLYAYNNNLKEHAMTKFPKEYAELLSLLDDFAEEIDRAEPTASKWG